MQMKSKKRAVTEGRDGGCGPLKFSLAEKTNLKNLERLPSSFLMEDEQVRTDFYAAVKVR